MTLTTERAIGLRERLLRQANWDAHCAALDLVEPFSIVLGSWSETRDWALRYERALARWDGWLEGQAYASRFDAETIAQALATARGIAMDVWQLSETWHVAPAMARDHWQRRHPDALLFVGAVKPEGTR